MDHSKPQDTLQSKGDKRPSDNTGTSDQDGKRLAIRRVRSPSRPRAWGNRNNKPKFTGKFNKPNFRREDNFANKPGFNKNRYPQPKGKFNFHRRDQHMTNRLVAAASRDRNHQEQFEERKSNEKSSPNKQNNGSRTFVPKFPSSRDKDKQFGSKSDKSKSRESDHRGSRSKERDRSRDEELPSTASQAAARDRAIQQKRREIDEVYYQECEMFGLVVKMLIAKDPSLESSIQASLQQNLRDIGARCVEAMEKFIEDYDSKTLSH